MGATLPLSWGATLCALWATASWMKSPNARCWAGDCGKYVIVRAAFIPTPLFWWVCSRYCALILLRLRINGAIPLIRDEAMEGTMGTVRILLFLALLLACWSEAKANPTDCGRAMSLASRFIRIRSSIARSLSARPG